MNAAGGRMSDPGGGMHPAVFSRRLQSASLLAASLLIPLAVAIAVSVADSKPSLTLAVAVVAGSVLIVWLLTNRRLDLSVMALALYLGLLEGPVKLGSGGHELASVMRDVVIFAVALGALMRLLAAHKPIRLPPLSPWVLGWAALVVVEGLNPRTHGITKALGGYRQLLEWVPFFFFGYAVMRSKRRFRQMFMVLAVIALANGVIGTYQAGLSPGQLASWGPGYRELALGTLNQASESQHGLPARAFFVEGEARVRPPAFGSDAGAGAGWGMLALPATLALLAMGGLRRKWLIVVCALGALAGVATGEGRQQVIGTILAVLIFAVLSFSAGRRVTRPLAVMLGVIVLALPVGLVFVSALGGQTFSRYTSLGELSSGSKDTKFSTLLRLPHNVEQAPLGEGLGIAGAAAGFGGIVKHEGIEEHGIAAETQYNFVAQELGLPGLLLWVGLTGRLIWLGLTGLRRITDLDLRLALAAMLTSLIGSAIIGISGPTLGSESFGPFFWFTAGTFGYWFIARRRRATLSQPQAPPPVAVPA